MRDPERIPDIIDLLEQAWEAFPDMRLGQLIINAAHIGANGKFDPYQAEDDVIKRGLNILLGYGKDL